MVGPAGLAIPVAGVRARRADRHLHPGPRREARGPRRDRHHGADRHPGGRAPQRAGSRKLFFSKGGGGITAYIRSADEALDLLLRPSAAAMRRACAKDSGSAARRSRSAVSASTGNANPAGPHLHFAINRMEPGEKWYQGTPINPYPLLAGKPVTARGRLTGGAAALSSV